MAPRNLTSLALVAMAAGLLLLALAIGYYYQPNTPQPPPSFLTALQGSLAQTDRIELQRGERHTILQLTKQGWRVANRDNFPADTARIRQLLLALQGMEIKARKTAQADHYDAIGVASVAPDSPTLELQLRQPVPQNQTEAFHTLLLGKQPQLNEYYLRPKEDAQSWLVKLEMETLSAFVGDWLHRRLLPLPAEQISRITLSGKNPATIVPDDSGSFQITKGSADPVLTVATLQQMLDGAAIDVAPLTAETLETLTNMPIRAEVERHDGLKIQLRHVPLQSLIAIHFTTTDTANEDTKTLATNLQSQYGGYGFIYPPHLLEALGVF